MRLLTSAKPFWLPSATAPHPVRDSTRPWARSSKPSAREPMRSKRRRDSTGCATPETNCATQLHPSAGPRPTSQQPQLHPFSRMRTKSWIVPTPRKARHPDSVRQPNREGCVRRRPAQRGSTSRPRRPRTARSRPGRRGAARPGRCLGSGRGRRRGPRVPARGAPAQSVEDALPLTAGSGHAPSARPVIHRPRRVRRSASALEARVDARSAGRP